ncbi:Inosine-5'-monophosphate dehydrogenase [Fundidesulfovibrio magnetotacticus]|uniref:Inosine-5'-monophosphate dehydrogenase n=1 Tax=Fundidesulfovibrio magnetotacticus TaxID=2730080 RepID=A0A6V8M652_9BACT|nr:CBS and ACT domain-containing protein [Fundidesulfovibrio magnetotacticus]GFK96095.1 Inosine-5'-monophosphate dehydrogenase [Fundidesulfovibrio magnetotacticus]
MLVGDWMLKDVTTVTEDVSMVKAGRIMQQRGIRRLPVVDSDGHLIGIVTERDIKAASPSKATSLDIYDMTRLLSEIKVRDIMTKKPLTIRPDDSVARAAAIMRDNKVGGLPVVDGYDAVVGIITATDIFRLFTMISGVDQGGVHLAAVLPVEKGHLKQLIDDLRAQDAKIVSILSHLDQGDESKRRVYIRLRSMTEAEDYRLRDHIKARHQLLYWVRD